MISTLDSAGAAQPRLTDVSIGDPSTQLTIRFTDGEAGLAAAYGVEMRTNLTTAVWIPIPSTVVSAGSSNWLATVSVAPETARAFFRITKQGEPLSASFQSTFGDVAEGDPNSGLRLLFPEPYAGPIRYEVDYQDGAGPVTRTAQGSGASEVFLPVPLPDDAQAGPRRQVTVRLLEEPGAGYVPGNIRAVSLTVHDNDTIWDGLLEDDNAGLPFTLRIVAQGGVTTALLTSDGRNLLPAGEHAATTFGLILSDRFFATFGPLTVTGTLTPTGQAMQLTLTLDATHQATPEESVGGDLITGRYELTAEVPGVAHLRQVSSGPFQLLRRVLPAAGVQR